MGSKSQPENKRLQFAFSYFFFSWQNLKSIRIHTPAFVQIVVWSRTHNQNIQIWFAYFSKLRGQGFCRYPCSVNLPIRGQTLNFGLISKFRFKKSDWTFVKSCKFWFWTFKKLLSDEFDFYIHSKYWMFAIWIFVYWNGRSLLLKFIYSEKATKFCEISTVDCQSNLRWRFRKIIWPSQNIWTLLFYDDLAI